MLVKVDDIPVGKATTAERGWFNSQIKEFVESGFEAALVAGYPSGGIKNKTQCHRYRNMLAYAIKTLDKENFVKVVQRGQKLYLVQINGGGFV